MNFLKQIIKFAFVLIFANVLLGSQHSKQKKSSSIDYEVFVDEVIYTFVKEIMEEFGFICNKTGGKMSYDVEKINVGFIAHQKAPIDIARSLELLLMDKFLIIINSHEKIRPFLREYPFRPKNIDISISFRNKQNQPETENSISYVFHTNNTIYYDIYNPANGTLIDFMSENVYFALDLAIKKLPRNLQCAE